MTMKWSVLKVSVSTDATHVRKIVSADWSVQHDGASYIKYGATAFDDPSDSFVAFDKVTNEMIIEWIKQKENIALIEAELEANSTEDKKSVFETIIFE